MNRNVLKCVIAVIAALLGAVIAIMSFVQKSKAGFKRRRKCEDCDEFFDDFDNAGFCNDCCEFEKSCEVCEEGEKCEGEFSENVKNE